MKNMQVGIYSPHWTTQKTKINHHILVYVLSTDYQFLKLEKIPDLNFFLLPQILLKIVLNATNTIKYFLFSKNNYFQI